MDIRTSVLLTDLYQLTMLQSYWEQGMQKTSVFELFVRHLPPQRGFLMAAGLEQVVDFLEDLHFSPWELEWIAKSGRFTTSFVDYLEQLRFTGDLHAMPEGTVFFPNEPIVRVTAPLPQAQIIETRVINLLHYQTLIASKAARCILVASGKPVIDFGLRRAHGAEAGLLASRACYMAGFSGTATVLGGALYEIPVFGTMAHSFIQAHADESEAFAHFADAQPENIILLIDTYNIEEGARKVVALALQLHKKGISIKGVRIDSGDLVAHAFKVRDILDAGGLPEVEITVSGNLDEYAIRGIVEANAPIDFFAVGTKLTTSGDAPYLDCAYKLQEYDGRACRKKSEGKSTWPGRKQIYRHFDQKGHFHYDVVTKDDDTQEGEAIIQPVMKSGERCGVSLSLLQIQEYARTQLTQLPEELRNLREGATGQVKISQAIRQLAKSVDQQQGANPK